MIDAPERPAPTPAQRKRRAAEAKGKRLQKRVADWLTWQGWRVEPARKVVVWVFAPEQGRKLPKQVKHDFFGVWDGVAVKGQHRRFYQVTTLNHLAHKRAKIASAMFPATTADRVFGYEGHARFRVLVGPRFEMPGEVVLCSVPRKRRTSR